MQLGIEHYCGAGIENVVGYYIQSGVESIYVVYCGDEFITKVGGIYSIALNENRDCGDYCNKT
jgi:hypothetical protein